MTREEFIEAVNKLKIDPIYYSIDGEIREDTFNLEIYPDTGLYITYYLERGDKIEQNLYFTPEEAYDWIYKKLKSGLDHGLDLTKSYKEPSAV